MVDSSPKNAHGGRRPGSGRKRAAVKVKSTHRLPESAATKAATDAGKAVSEGVFDDAQRLARHALHAQKREMTSKMGELGLAPLDVLQSCMLRLYERALDARAAGGALVTLVRDKPIMTAGGIHLVDEDGKPMYLLTARVDTEVGLVLAAADVANKAAQYVHPKLVAVDAKVTEMTYEERLQRLFESTPDTLQTEGCRATRPTAAKSH